MKAAGRPLRSSYRERVFFRSLLIAAMVLLCAGSGMTGTYDIAAGRYGDAVTEWLAVIISVASAFIVIRAMRLDHAREQREDLEQAALRMAAAMKRHDLEQAAARAARVMRTEGISVSAGTGILASMAARRKGAR